MSEMRVLVLGAGGAAADNYIKSLRLATPSIFVLGVDTHPLMLELSCASETRVIDTTPADGGVHFGTIADLVDQHDITMVHAQPDQEALFLALEWEGIPVSGPARDVVEACQDKLACARLLGDLAPESWPYLGHAWERDTVRWMRARSGAGSLAAKRVDGLGAAACWRGSWEGRVAPDDFMVSEYLPGEDRSYTGVWWKGEPVASACRVRVEYADTRTPSGQCSSPRIAKLDSRPETFDVAEAAIRRVSDATGTVSHGIFYVDMREAADGRLLVTEINAGRFNTTQNFYAEAGVNLPYIHARMHHDNTGHGLRGFRLERSDDADVYWVRQADMGHKLVVKPRVHAGIEYLYRGNSA